MVYAPTAEPDSADDWLLDIRLYSRSFRADRASIILDELGLENHHLRDHLTHRRRFFDNKERLQKLKTLVTSTDTAGDLDRKMLAVVVKADQPELFTILRTLFHTWTDVEDTDDIDVSEPPACWDAIEKFDLAQSFWQVISQTFGYREDTPSLRNLLIRLLVADYAAHLRGDIPPAFSHLLLPRSGHANAVVCLAQWRDSSSKGSSYDLLSAEVARILKIEEHVAPLEIEQLLDVMTFLDVEKAMMRGLRDRLLQTAETLDVEALRDIATRRLDGHWASRTLPASSTVPRQALTAVYDALMAAAALFDLRNHYTDGFHFDTAAAMYRAYETDLYRFDQRYRQCCTAADLAESQNWDVLKTLREQVEALYVHWYLTHLTLAWGTFVDPAGSTGLLQRWRLDQVPNQQQFYQRHVQRRLDEADNRKVFVMISDAFRYEAAQELTQVLNGTYRFEAELTSQLGVLPSYTALGMASLLPHQTLTYQENGSVLVDGKAAASLDHRSAVLAAVNGVAIRAADLLAMKKDQGRAFVGQHRVIYVYHNQVDAIGDTASTEAQTFQAVRTAITEIAHTVRYIVNTLNGNVSNTTVKQYEKLLVGGIWSIITLQYIHEENQKGSPFLLGDLKPVQMLNMDLEELFAGRRAFTEVQWIDVLLRSTGLEPTHFDERVKWHFLCRMVPLVENNYNVCELGPRGTGKSHIYKEISPNSILISGGHTTVANLFYNLARRTVGLVGLWDVVAFDEVAGIAFQDKDGVQIMKDYMASGSFARGRDAISAYASMVFVGNIENVEVLVKTSHLLAPFPAR